MLLESPLTYSCTNFNQRKRYLDELRATVSQTTTGRPLDGIICPVAPFPAPPHGQYVYAGYTCVWNVLDLPSVAIPVTMVDQNIDVPDQDYKPRSETDRIVYTMYDGPGKFQDASVGIQVVGKRWREEECLGLARVVDDALKAKAL